MVSNKVIDLMVKKKNWDWLVKHGVDVTPYQQDEGMYEPLISNKDEPFPPEPKSKVVDYSDWDDNYPAKITVRLTEELRDRLTKISGRNGKSTVVRKLIEDYCKSREEHEKFIVDKSFEGIINDQKERT